MNLNQILAAASTANDTHKEEVEYQGKKFPIYILKRVPGALGTDIESVEYMGINPFSAILSHMTIFAPDESGRNRMTPTEFSNLDRDLHTQIYTHVKNHHPELFGFNKDGTAKTAEQRKEEREQAKKPKK